MQVDVETRDDSGRQLGAAKNTTYRTDVFSEYGAQADAEIARIIAQNTVADRSAAPKTLAKRNASQRAG